MGDVLRLGGVGDVHPEAVDGVRWRVGGATVAHVFGGEDQLFRVTFDNQATEWIIGFGDDGKIAALLFRPAEA